MLQVYLDPATIDVAAWHGREDTGVLVVPRAGETLFRLKKDPAKTALHTTGQAFKPSRPQTEQA